MPQVVNAYAAQAADQPLGPHQISRRDVGEKDIEIEIQYCGVCHSDLHFARNEWKMTQYPIVPGHEIVGKVISIGSGASKFKVGDSVGVGCLVDSCRTCSSCEDDLEQHCLQEGGPIFSYNSPEKQTGEMTYGGYSQKIITDEDYVLKVPENLDLAASAPLLCAGITTYSPLRRFKVGAGQKVGVIGLGGLGHMGVKFAHAMGADVYVFSRSKSKEADAKKLGANEVIISTDEAEMMKHMGSFDFILDTVSADHDLNAYLNLLKISGTLVLVGAPENPQPVAAFSLLFGRRNLAGSLIGGIKETQEMLDFCGEHNIVSDIEMIRMDQINEAYERMLKSDVKYRFVIDIASLK